MSNETLQMHSVLPLAVRRWPRRAVYALVAMAVLLVAGLGVRSLFRGTEADATVSQGEFYTVPRKDLTITLALKGELASVNNTEISSEVEGQVAIQWLIEEGSTVKKGDKLVTLDSSELHQKVEDFQKSLDEAESDLIIATEMKDIQESQNSANLEAAQVAVELARIDLQQYIEGTYPQSLQNARTALEMARITLKNKEEDLAQTRSLFSKGFVTAADVKKAELDVTVATNDVKKAETALNVLEKYTHSMELESKRSALAQAEQKLARTRRENASNLALKTAEYRTKLKVRDVTKQKLEHYRQQEANCTILAPQDGIVVYASSGDRYAREQIQEGTMVRERQTLLRLPDVRAMKVVVRVQDSQRHRLRENQQTALVTMAGRPDPLTATLTHISPLPDSSQRWWDPDLKEYPTDLVLDYTPEGLRPGSNVDAEIFIESRPAVLVVPPAAVYYANTSCYVFVRKGETVEPVAVQVREGNAREMEVASGLTQGDEVLLLQPGQGRALLEKNGIRPPSKPTTQPAFPEAKRRTRSKPVAAAAD